MELLVSIIDLPLYTLIHIVEEANHMHYKRDINYYNLSKIVIFFQHRNVHVQCVFSTLRDK